MTSGVDDDLWSAIGDPTRRRMVDLLLADDRATATKLSEQLPVSRQAVARRLAVLDRAGLVHVTPAGRERHYRIDDANWRAPSHSCRPWDPSGTADSAHQAHRRVIQRSKRT